MNRKLKQVTLTFENEDGSITRESLRDEAAEAWDKFCIQTATAAYIHGMNPAWESLKWDKRDIPKSKTEPSLSNELYFTLDATKTSYTYQINDRLGALMYLIWGDTTLERLADLIYRKQPENVSDKEALVPLLEYLRKSEDYELKRNSKE